MATEDEDSLFSLWPDLSADEVARRIYSNPDLFAEYYSDERESLKQTNIRLMEQDPMQYVEFIDNWAEALPKFFQEAVNCEVEFFKTKQLQELSESLFTMLSPPRSFPHPAIKKQVDFYRPLFNHYLQKIKEAKAEPEQNRVQVDPAQKLHTPSIKGGQGRVSTISNRNKRDAEYLTLKDIFNDPEEFDKCIDALQLISSPVLSDTRTWIGESRGGMAAIAAWWDTIRKRGKIKSVSKIKFCKLLEDYIPGLILDTKTASFLGKSTEWRTSYSIELEGIIK
ncbi:hypothetical protein F5984_06805 [Rudanella paleaurantiibacter]|uniref:Uncharacterized protein n=1 Tax=Rudanella paleaurantiibacter TaxID=2614655 RepID=A0A7J5U4G8_9BACT|nr:hypothetical protein [Rudanella paleaurantiibacter]KAB7731925.1 hypothetical protein F5984_06805 [Rudanella paleaurantiibacter]